MTDYYSDIQNLLDQMGINRPMHLLVHSGLREMGGRAARPLELIQSLLERVESSGTGCLLMPTYQPPVPLEDYIYTDPLYDPRTTPSHVGSLTQLFMTEFPSRRSYHPWLAVSALGNNALEYVKDHHLDLRPHAERSPFYKLTQHPDGYILLIGGASYRNNSSQRILESIIHNYPYQVFLKKPLTMRYLNYEGIEHKMQTFIPNRRYMPRLERWGRDIHTQYPHIGQRLVSPLGYHAILLHAQTLLEAQQDAFKKGMYLQNDFYGGRPAKWRQWVISTKRALGIRGRLFHREERQPPQGT